MTMEWGAPRQKHFLLGLDLGQVRDYTALVIAQQGAEADPVYTGRHIERWQDERYTKLVEIVKERIDALNVWPSAEEGGGPKPDMHLVIDHTGVGRPVLDMFLDADLGIPIVGVTITSGQQVTKNDDGFGVPKRVLASTMQVLIQTGRLRVIPGLKDAEILNKELQNFRVKINAGGHDSYGAGDDWRENNHDDLVLAAALACWYGENEPSGWEAVPPDLIRSFFRLGL